MRFFTNKIEYLWPVIHPSRLEIANYNTDATRDLKVLTTQTELHSFINLCNIFCRFVPSFARTTSLLIVRLRKSPAKEFGHLKKEELTGSWTLKERLISPMVFALLRKGGRYTLNIGTCERQLWCVFLRKKTIVSTDQSVIGLEP